MMVAIFFSLALLCIALVLCAFLAVMFELDRIEPAADDAELSR